MHWTIYDRHVSNYSQQILLKSPKLSRLSNFAPTLALSLSLPSNSSVCLISGDDRPTSSTSFFLSFLPLPRCPISTPSISVWAAARDSLREMKLPTRERDVVVGERKWRSRRSRRGCDKEIAEVGTDYRREEELDSTTSDWPEARSRRPEVAAHAMEKGAGYRAGGTRLMWKYE